MEAFIRRLVLTGLAIAVATCARQSVAQESFRRAVPGKWIEPYLPEDLEPLDLPEYVTKAPIEQARAEAFAGRYKIALLTLAKSKDAVAKADPADVALIKASALAPLGRRDEAIAVLSAKNVAADPRVEVMRARILAEMGKTDQAIALLKQHLKAHADSIPGHFWLGTVSEKIGDLDAAREAFGFFEPFIEKWQGDNTQFTSAEEVTLIGRSLDRWANLTNAYQTKPVLHNAILSMFLKAYDRIDRGYWPAHLAAAEFYYAHDDEQSAVKELKQALARNPQDIGCLNLLGRIVIGAFNFDATEAQIAAIREVDPDAIEAELLAARCFMRQHLAKDAQPPIRRVLARQPKNLEALGLLAASEALQLHDDKTAEVLKEVDKLDPHNATAYLEVAEQLSSLRQYPRSAAMYKIAIERAPWWTSPRNGLGLLYTQSGDEDQAAVVLEQARLLDPFNHETTNYLRLLDDLKNFARKETAHFVVFYDARKDPLIPEYFADYLESIYKDVTGEYKKEPPVKTYIEVFPTHDGFSVRTTGLPWLGTVGASTGRVIALVTPRTGKGTMGAFNWAAVLRHEFTHTVTLAATDNRIAHWMTEGLAVMEEHSPLRWEWVPMLYQAVNKKQLFTMENLTWGFVRPKRPIDRQLAYAESFWICTYIEETWGHEAILKMLEEFRQGKEQREVFPLILGKSLTEFQSDFFAWTEHQVAGWGYDEETTKKVNELKKKGEELIKAHDYKEAVKVWEQIMTLRPVDALPHARLAALYLTDDVHQPEKAVEHLIALHKVELNDDRYAKRIARLYRDMGKLDDALKYGTQAVYMDPYDQSAHELLLQLYEKSGDDEKAAREKKVIEVLEQWKKTVDQKK